MPRRKEDINEKYSYVLDYINEAAEARRGLKDMISRSVDAYKKNPSVHIYKRNADSWYQSISASHALEQARCDAIKANCDSIPEGHNDTVFNAIETVTSMAMGGAGQFECAPVDRWFDKDSELTDRQEMYLDFAYRQNHLDAIAPETVRKLFMQGQFNYHIKPIDGKSGQYKISLIDAYKMLLDPRRSKTNRERFIGYTEVTSWSAVKDAIYKEGKDYKLKSINEVDVYMSELNNWYSLGSEALYSNELSEDLNTFFSIYNMPHTQPDPVIHEDGTQEIFNGYQGDDVEIAYVWDSINSIYFRVINRRFIVSAKKNPLKGSVDIVTYTYENDKPKKHTEKYEVEIDSPIVHRGLINADWETYPITPLWYCLDEFDILCAKDSILEHNLSIMAPITFMASNHDAEILSGLSQIAGQIVEGSSATMQVMNKVHDISAIQLSIDRSEQRIKRMMGATDQYELAQLLNNRATGAEVSMANAAVSQRMNIALAKLEDGYVELMEKILKMNVIFYKDKEYTFPYKDGVGIIEDNELVGMTITECRLKSRIKSEQKEQSQNALLLLQSMVGLIQTGAVDAKRVFATLIPLISMGVISRREAVALVDDSLKLTPEQMDQIIASERKAAAERAEPMYGADQLSPEDMAILEQQIMQTSQTPQPTQSQAMPTGADQYSPIPAGMDPSTAGMVSNESAMGLGPQQ